MRDSVVQIQVKRQKEPKPTKLGLYPPPADKDAAHQPLRLLATLNHHRTTALVPMGRDSLVEYYKNRKLESCLRQRTRLMF